jgi:hypothetical protein
MVSGDLGIVANKSRLIIRLGNILEAWEGLGGCGLGQSWTRTHDNQEKNCDRFRVSLWLRLVPTVPSMLIECSQAGFSES